MKHRLPVRVSVIIKALNEEKNIATTIESSIDALSGLQSEIILADSYSTDRTVEIASQYPIRIVQLENPNERCCGIGGQMGFQYAAGEFIWIVDGDMTLQRNFIEEALKFLEVNPQTAGVGGRVVERNLESLEFRARVQRAPNNLKPGVVDRLDGGGVYRRSAIESCGYFTNRNLHSYEEYELAIRLRNAGWELNRIDLVAASHFGHKTAAYQLLRKRWRSRYAFGIGELLKSAIGEKYFLNVIIDVREVQVYGLVIFWWMTLGALLPLGFEYGMSAFYLLLFLLALPFLIMICKKKSIATAIYSVVSWNIYAMGLIRGLLHRQIPPHDPIACTEITNRPSETH